MEESKEDANITWGKSPDKESLEYEEIGWWYHQKTFDPAGPFDSLRDLFAWAHGEYENMNR